MYNGNEYVQVIRHREEMLQSYCDAIRKVGGCPMHSLDRLGSMTVKEMIDVLAQNGVRFTTNRK